MQNKLDKDFFKLCFNLPPEEAIKFLEKKGLKVSIDWFDLYREEHVRAFTVAGITKLDVLKDIRDALVEAQKNGETLESFKQNIIPKLRQKGWYGNRLVIREDGSEKEVNVSSPWRLKTIYRTNMAVAAMTGLYKELKAASDVMPYWRYVTVGDGRVREEHAKIHGKILRHDDPFWDNYFPPNGYNCRCSVEGITETEFKKKGYKLSDGKSMANLVMPFVKTGWDYNPGKEYYTPKSEEYSKELQPIAEKIDKEADKMADSIKGNDIKVNEPVMDIAKVEKPADYEEAKSIEAAEEYAVKTLGVKRASFKGLPLDIVNEFNYALKKAVEKYPKIIEENFLNFVGSISERDRLLKELIHDKAYAEAIENSLPVEEHIKNTIDKYIKPISNSTILQNLSRYPNNDYRKIFEEYSGITINKDYEYMDNLALLEVNLSQLVASKQHPVGTGSLKASVDHEIGHILDELLKLSENEEIREQFYSKYNEDTTEDKISITDNLSRYAWKNDQKPNCIIKEYIAEACAEFNNNPEPREIATTVGNIAKKEYNKKYERKQKNN